MVAFLKRMPSGFAGSVTRELLATKESQFLSTTAAPTAFGVAVALDAATQSIRAITTGDVAANVYGLLIRPYASGTNSVVNDAIGAGAPVAGMCTVLRRGYMTVQLNGTQSSVIDGVVYLRVANPSAGKPLGGFESVNDTSTAGNTVAINATFMGAVDAGGIVEIGYNI